MLLKTVWAPRKAAWTDLLLQSVNQRKQEGQNGTKMVHFRGFGFHFRVLDEKYELKIGVQTTANQTPPGPHPRGGGVELFSIQHFFQAGQLETWGFEKTSW